MTRRTKLFIAVGLALALIVIVIVVAVLNQKPADNKPKVNLTPAKILPVPSKEEVSTAIAQQAGDELYLTTSNFVVTDINSPASQWFVASVHPLNGADDAKAIIRQNDDASLSLIAGPGTAFLSTDLTTQGVPGSVQRTVVVYEN